MKGIKKIKAIKISESAVVFKIFNDQTTWFLSIKDRIHSHEQMVEKDHWKFISFNLGKEINWVVIYNKNTEEASADAYNSYGNGRWNNFFRTNRQSREKFSKGIWWLLIEIWLDYSHALKNFGVLFFIGLGFVIYYLK